MPALLAAFKGAKQGFSSPYKYAFYKTWKQELAKYNLKLIKLY